MAISRRAFGIGLVAASAAATGGYLYLRDHPEIAGRFGEPKKLFGFAGGEKEGFLANTRVRELLERRFGLVLDARARRVGRDGARTRTARLSIRNSSGLLPPSSSKLHAAVVLSFPVTR